MCEYHLTICMENQLSADQPISEKIEDKFQRYEFAKQVANTIAARKSIDSIVIGLFGAWGEGKTSVINFIETELNSLPDIIILKFNPWMYKEENSLLL